MRSYADVQRLVVIRVWPAGPLPASRIRAAVTDPLGERFKDRLRKIVSHGLLHFLQEPDCSTHKPRLYPAGRAALDRDVAPEVAEHLPHPRRKHLQPVASPVLPVAAHLMRFTKQPAARTALDQHQVVL